MLRVAAAADLLVDLAAEWVVGESLPFGTADRSAACNSGSGNHRVGSSAVAQQADRA